eukprot:c12083_g1_i1 orf=441-614(+)
MSKFAVIIPEEDREVTLQICKESVDEGNEAWSETASSETYPDQKLFSSQATLPTSKL